MSLSFKAVIEFLKKETVLAVSGLLALLSCFLVRPDREYLNYFSSNMGTIIVLFCLMAVVAGLSGLGVFRYVGERLLERIQSERGIVFLLVFLCFFGSMFITNDVALITFVPFGIMILKMAGMTGRLCRVVTLMTIAANLGSMFTPMGNPQNLYLYSISRMTLSAFLRLMLPHTAAAALLLCLCVFFGVGKEKTCVTMTEQAKNICRISCCRIRKLISSSRFFLACSTRKRRIFSTSPSVCPAKISSPQSEGRIIRSFRRRSPSSRSPSLCVTYWMLSWQSTSSLLKRSSRE